MCLWDELTATLRQKKVASKLNFTEIPYKSIVALRFSGGYISLLVSILLGTSGHLVKPCETDPMCQGSLLAVLAYGGLTFRLRFAYGRDSYSFGFSKGDLSYKWYWIRRWSLIILKIHLRQPYGCGTLCMTWLTSNLTDTLRTSGKSLRRVWILVSRRSDQYIWNLERCSADIRTNCCFLQYHDHA